jgi:pimeloyl-ACP methyl ester carboxylesterase
MPDATPDELEWFDEFQRQTTSAENAVKFLEAFAEIDVRERLATLDVPTLVIHSRGDKRIPLATGRELAAAIPNAQFVGVDSNNHLLLGREPASEVFLSAVRDFLQT